MSATKENGKICKSIQLNKPKQLNTINTTSYPNSVASYNTQSVNETGAFYQSCAEQRRMLKGHRGRKNVIFLHTKIISDPDCVAVAIVGCYVQRR